MIENQQAHGVIIIENISHVVQCRYVPNWFRLAIPVGLLVALPVLSVGANLFVGAAGDTWAHLAATVLPDYILNSLLLALMVGLGVAVVGVATAWLTAMTSFPAGASFEWALLLPLAMPAYVMAYVYTDLLQFVGPVQTALREWFGWKRGDYWFPEIRSLGGAAAMFICVLYPYVYLLARTAFLERGGSTFEAARSLGLTPWRRFCARVAAAGAAGHRRRRRAGADGNAGRLRHGRLLRRADLHHRHLPRLVLAGRPHRRRAAGRRACWPSCCAAGARTHQPRPRRVSTKPAGGAAQRRTLQRHERLAGESRLLAAAAVRLPAAGRPVVAAGARGRRLRSSACATACWPATACWSPASRRGWRSCWRCCWPTPRGSRGAPVDRGWPRIASSALGYAVPGSVIAVGVLIPVTRLDHWLAARLARMVRQ